MFFLIIGNRDPVVQLQWGRLSEEVFKTMGFKQYSFKEYNGLVHSSSDQVNTNKSLVLIILFAFI